MFDLALSDVSTFISGASGGIGLTTVDTFLEQDALVTAHYGSNRAPLEKYESSSRVSIVGGDVRSENDVDRMFEESRKKLGKAVEVLVVNHAYISLDNVPLSEMSLEQWNKTIGINLTGTFLLVRAFLRQLKHLEDKSKVAVVFVGSTAGLFGEAGHADYASSKSAMMSGLLLSLKNEIVAHAPRARVNCVGPGWVKTPAVAPVLDDPAVRYAALASTPLKKLAEPSDIAHQILALSSSTLSGHITGQVVMAHGGMEGRLLNKESDL